MNDSKDPLLLDHEVDGIKELDNNLPRWWVWLFYITTAYAIVYMVYYHAMGAGDLMVAEYDKEMAVGESIKNAAIARFEGSIDSASPSTDPVVIARGQQIFATTCAPCNGVQGQGIVGSNLTDDYWIHGSTFQDSLRTIYNGVPEKGMISWKDSLKPDQILASASYIYTLRGTNPPNPKPPENQQQPASDEPSPFE